MKNHQYTRAFVLLFLSSVTFFACEQIEKPQSKRTAKGEVSLGGTLKVPVVKAPDALNPLNMKGADASQIGVHVLEGLVRLDPKTSKIIPGLAESWSMESSGNSYVFNLRKGAKFHANTGFDNLSREVTTADVVYSFEQLAKNADSTLFKATLGGRLLGGKAYRSGEAPSIQGLYVVDDYTLKMVLTKPDESFLYVLAQPAMGVVSKNLGAEAEGVSAGPFRLLEAGEGVALVRNPDYYLQDEFGNKFPYIDTLKFVQVGQNSEKLDAFFEGKIDIIRNMELDPVRSILESHVADFSGKDAKYIMQREADNASYETYSIYRKGIKHMGSGFMGYQDFSRTQIEQ